MFKSIGPVTLTAILAMQSGPAFAGACDYRPSNLMGGGASSAVATGGSALAAVGVGAKAAGFYTLTNAITGATMLGSTAGGVSAAGTVGIMGGTAGAIGTVASFVMAPATIVIGAVLGVGVGAYEGVCYFTVERVDNSEVLEGIVDNLAENSDPEYLRIATVEDTKLLLIATAHDDSGKAVGWEQYEIAKLYIEEGMLKHSDLGPNTKIGKVAMVQQDVSMQEK